MMAQHYIVYTVPVAKLTYECDIMIKGLAGPRGQGSATCNNCSLGRDGDGGQGGGEDELHDGETMLSGELVVGEWHGEITLMGIVGEQLFNP